MFWNKKLKLPVTEEDKEWIEEGLLMLSNEFGADHFKSLYTILPNKEFYDNDFTGSETDAEFILNQTKIYMDIADDRFQLEFFSDTPVNMADGTLLSSPADINGKWNSAAGLYEESEDITRIHIERSQLKNPSALVATMSHELAHHILLGEGRTDVNDEYLTDLVAIVYGFGIFLGNNHFNFTKYSDVKSNGWSMSRTGYLPEQVIAYAMAWLCSYREEEPFWKNLLNATMLKHFDQSIAFIKKYPEKIKFE